VVVVVVGGMERERESDREIFRKTKKELFLKDQK
jgi:hypothetical protein